MTKKSCDVCKKEIESLFKAAELTLKSTLFCLSIDMCEPCSLRMRKIVNQFLPKPLQGLPEIPDFIGLDKALKFGPEELKEKLGKPPDQKSQTVNERNNEAKR